MYLIIFCTRQKRRAEEYTAEKNGNNLFIPRISVEALSGFFDFAHVIFYIHQCFQLRNEKLDI